MTDQVVSIATIQARARRAFAAGKPLADCTLPPHSAAYATYSLEFYRLEKEAARSPSLQCAAAGRTRIDAQQTGHA